MRKLITIFIILLIAIGLGFLIQQDSGYVLVAYEGWTLETSMWVAVAALIIVFFALHYLLRFIKHTRLLGDKFHAWGQSRKERAVIRNTNLGLCELAEGNWQKAENILTKAAKNSPSPLINYLSAAQAADAQQAFDRRDQYLKQAHQSTEGAEIAVGLTQARLQINSKQWEQAIATLKHLNQIDPKHHHTLKLLHEAHLELSDWKHLKELLPSLRKHKVLTPAELTTLEEDIFTALLDNAKNHANSDTLTEVWNSAPKILKQDGRFTLTYACYLLADHQDQLALPIIENTLKKHWNDELVSLYGKARSESPSKQLTTAESWLSKHPKEPKLLLTLGQLSIRESLIGKAKDYLQESIAIKPSKEAYHLLAEVMESLNEKDTALEYYRKAVSI